MTTEWHCKICSLFFVNKYKLHRHYTRNIHIKTMKKIKRSECQELLLRVSKLRAKGFSGEQTAEVLSTDTLLDDEHVEGLLFYTILYYTNYIYYCILKAQSAM